MRRTELQLLLPALFCWFINCSECVPEDNKVEQALNSTNEGIGAILTQLDAKMAEILKRSQESEGVMQSVLEKVQILQDRSERLEQMSLRMESSLEFLKIPWSPLEYSVSTESVIPEATEVPEVIKTNPTVSGHTDPGTRIFLPNLTSAANELPSDQEIKESILKSPHAKLFTKADKSGNAVVYDFNSHSREGGCYNLPYPKYGGQIKLVDTEGKCVRLFSAFFCKGWSQSIYPGSRSIPDAKLNGVRSIGPCVTNEFEHSAISKSGPPQLEKLPSPLETFANVPDLIRDAYTRSEAFTSVDTDSNPVEKYLLGPGNRVEAIKGFIYPLHLKSPEVAKNARVTGLEQSFYSKLELEESDEPGFVIPLELGGPADQIYNVFPQNQKQAVTFKGKIVPLVKQYLTDDRNRSVEWDVNFFYKNSNTLRPSGIWYRGRTDEIFYGYLPNSE